MAEFPNLGAHCAFQFCSCLDFLPFLCEGCNKTYCLEHRRSSDHQCTNPISSVINERIPTIANLKRCSKTDCRNRELEVIVCKHCNSNFCLSHRHQQDHDCTALIPIDNSESKTSILVNSILESKNCALRDENRRRQSKKSTKLSAQLNLMKMKMVANGDKGLPQDDRVYLAATVPGTDTDEDDVTVRSGTYFFSKEWTVGRVVDHVATAEKLWNGNNISTAKKLLMFTSDSEQPLPMDSPLKQLIWSNVLYNGGNVRLKYSRSPVDTNI